MWRCGMMDLFRDVGGGSLLEGVRGAWECNEPRWH